MIHKLVKSILDSNWQSANDEFTFIKYDEGSISNFEPEKPFKMNCLSQTYANPNTSLKNLDEKSNITEFSGREKQKKVEPNIYESILPSNFVNDTIDVSQKIRIFDYLELRKIEIDNKTCILNSGNTQKKISSMKKKKGIAFRILFEEKELIEYMKFFLEIYDFETRKKKIVEMKSKTTKCKKPVIETKDSNREASDKYEAVTMEKLNNMIFISNFPMVVEQIHDFIMDKMNSETGKTHIFDRQKMLYTEFLETFTCSHEYNRLYLSAEEMSRKFPSIEGAEMRDMNSYKWVELLSKQNDRIKKTYGSRKNKTSLSRTKREIFGTLQYLQHFLKNHNSELELKDGGINKAEKRQQYRYRDSNTSVSVLQYSQNHINMIARYMINSLRVVICEINIIESLVYFSCTEDKIVFTDVILSKQLDNLICAEIYSLLECIYDIPIQILN